MTNPTFRVTSGQIVYIIIICTCFFFIFKQNGGWNIDEALHGYDETMGRLQTGHDETMILDHFRKIQSLNKNYSIGVVAVTDHHPTFGGDDYRVYDIGYYDVDKRVRHLVHITCQENRIKKIDPVKAREPTAPTFIK